MITQRQQRGFILALKAGEIMMKSGGEIYRVEEVITRICHACNLHYVEVFTTTTGIIASTGTKGESGDIRTYLKAVPNRGMDMQKISDVNMLSRKFVSGQIDVEDAIDELTEIETRKSYPLPWKLFGAATVSIVYCFIFGGRGSECLIAPFAGILTYLVSILLSKINVGYFISNFCCCFFASFLALAAASFGLCSTSDHIIIGVIMMFVPGAAFTNALRDIMRGDMISGLSRTAEAISIAIALVAGAGLMIKLWNALGGLIV